MASKVQITTQVIQFGKSVDELDLHLSAEIDDRETGYNLGDTDFDPGDTAYFLVYKYSGLTLQAPIASAGSVAYKDNNGNAGAVVNITKTEYLTFANEDNATLDVPAKSITSKTWLGTNLGDTTLQPDEVTLKLNTKPASSFAGVLQVVYVAEATVGQLVSPASIPGPGGEDLTDFEICVVIIGELPES